MLLKLIPFFIFWDQATEIVTTENKPESFFVANIFVILSCYKGKVITYFLDSPTTLQLFNFLFWLLIIFGLFGSGTATIILFTQPLRTGRIWHKVNF